MVGVRNLTIERAAEKWKITFKMGHRFVNTMRILQNTVQQYVHNLYYVSSLGLLVLCSTCGISEYKMNRISIPHSILYIVLLYFVTLRRK